MIISTSKSDTMLRRVLKKDQTSIITIDKMIDQFSLDPELTNPAKEAFIVTDEDIRATRIKQKFEQAVQARHPKVKIIFVNKGAKAVYPNGLMGIDYILTKPKPEDISNAISYVISSDSTVEAANEAYASSEPEVVPEFTPQEQEQVFTRQYEEPAPVVEEPTPVEEPLPIPTPEPEPVPVQPVQISKSELVARNKRSKPY